MNAARVLRYARRRAGFSQRQLAAKTGIPQSTIGRIESGATDPRVSTLNRLVRACHYDLEVEPRHGEGVDRSVIRSLLERSPAERIEMAGVAADVFSLVGAARKTTKAS